MRQLFLEGRPLHIIPCRADKKPCTPHGHLDAVSDTPSIAKLWSRYPGPLVGVATGAIGGIDVIDIDPNGESWFHAHRDQLPQTRTHKTRREGWHLIYHHSTGLRCSTSKIAPGVDVKADGGYVIWWPSAAGRVLCDGPIAEFPRWLLDELVTRVIKRSALVANGGTGPLVVGTNHLPRELYFRILQLVVKRRDQRRVRGILSVVFHAVEGTRNTRLNWAAFSMRELIEAGVISRANAESLLMKAAECYAASDGVSAAMATVRSGLGDAAIRGPVPQFEDV